MAMGELENKRLNCVVKRLKALEIGVDSCVKLLALDVIVSVVALVIAFVV